jgi:Saxitoxin biosynthesis operon protein SxtJ
VNERSRLRHYSRTNAMSPEFYFIFTPVFHTVGYLSERCNGGFVTGSDGSWHETLYDEDATPGSSDRAFGFLFAAIAGVLAALSAWQGRRGALGWAIVAAGFLVVTLVAPPLLGPLNRAWRRLALLLSKLTTPLIMGLLFFVVIAPVGVIMRLAGKDPLRLRFETESSSYWLARSSQGDRQTSMTRQF